MSRRQVLSGATYGLGATLLFARAPGEAGGAAAVPHGGPRGGAPTGGAGPGDGGGHGGAGHGAGRGGPGAAGAGTTANPRRGAGFDAMRLSGDGQPHAACKGRQGVMVVGAGDDGAPTSWFNRGEVHWHRRTLATPVAGEPEVWGVTAHAGHFVAVGSMLQATARTVASADGGGGRVTFSGARRRPTIWWTSDSLTWHGQTLDGVDERHAQLISVSCNGALIVAVGSALDADGVQGHGALALVSHDDGDTWRRADIAPRDVSLAEGSFTAVTEAGGEWFATSTDIEGGAVWASPDGRRWAPLAGSARRFRGVTLQGIGARGGRLYAAGTSLTDHRPHYYVSTDRGRTWGPLRPRPAALDGVAATVNDLTVMSGEVVIVGTQDGLPVIEGGAPDGPAD